jgi:hypothetical protein
MKEKPTLFIDIDGVLATSTQFNVNRNKYHPQYNCYRFDKKCVNVLNQIIDAADPDLVLSSDWKTHFNLDAMNDIFEWNCINKKLIGFTPKLPIEYYTLPFMCEQRALEIIQYNKEQNINNFAIVDDLDLTQWFPNNFIICKRINEGIKQAGIKDKILKVIM